MINLTHFSLIFNFYTPALVWRRVRSYVHMLAHVLINLDERKIAYANRFYLPDTTQTKQHFLELNIFWGVRFFNWLSFLYFSLPVLASFFFLNFGFTPCKAEQPLRGIELQDKEAQKRLQHKGNLFRKNLQLKDVCQF